MISRPIKGHETIVNLPWQCPFLGAFRAFRTRDGFHSALMIRRGGEKPFQDLPFAPDVRPLYRLLTTLVPSVTAGDSTTLVSKYMNSLCATPRRHSGAQTAPHTPFSPFMRESLVYFETIGEIAIMWSYFGLQIDRETLRLGGINLVKGTCLTSQIAGVRRKIGAFISMARFKPTPKIFSSG